MKMYRLVTSNYVIKHLKTSKYFKINLGQVSYIDSSTGLKTLNTRDEFQASYNSFYKTNIYAKGSIGRIFFYEDMYITDNKIAIYHEMEEFVFDFDDKFVKEYGIDAYLSKILKQVDEEYSNIINNNNIKKEVIKEVIKEDIKEVIEVDKTIIDKTIETKEDILKTKPWAVNYNDIIEYMNNKRGL